jgi:NAD(P)-dependent dehydrogenase (short-subunit alcohol dehydrogenase family)
MMNNLHTPSGTWLSSEFSPGRRLRYIGPIMNSRFDLSGRVAVVTGGGRGLGKAMARAFAEAGADVVISSRSADELAAAAAEIGSGHGRRVEWIVADMSSTEQASSLGPEALARMGRVDILVNNAGSNVPQPIDEITDDAWSRILELNLSSSMRLTRAVVPQMKSRAWGRIIYISSILGFTAIAGRSIYCSTKAALMGLARANAMDLGPWGITANCIAPGPFLTDLPEKVLNEDQKRAYAERTAVGRWGRPDELAGPALLLASEAGSFITGTTLVVDGGVLARAI